MSALTAADDARPRSQQTTIGASQVHGCRRQVWLQLDGAPKLNPNVKRLPAMLGTAVHTMNEDAMAALHDPDWVLEGTWPGDPQVGLGDAHVDAYHRPTGRVIDYKSCKLKDARWLPKVKHWGQLALYADRMQAAGEFVSELVLLYIPRDGTEDDIKEFSRPWDRETKALAAAGKQWLGDLVSWDRATGLPPADYSGKICTDYCDFFSDEICQGKVS